MIRDDALQLLLTVDPMHMVPGDVEQQVKIALDVAKTFKRMCDADPDVQAEEKDR
jgi:hypothetical protein